MWLLLYCVRACGAMIGIEVGHISYPSNAFNTVHLEAISYIKYETNITVFS